MMTAIGGDISPDLFLRGLHPRGGAVLCQPRPRHDDFGAAIRSLQAHKSLPLRVPTSHIVLMQVHASCASLDGAGVILLGPSGCGKSDMLLRLIDRGFVLVADDRVNVEAGWATTPAQLAGLLEVRGLGVFRFPYCTGVQLVLAVDLGRMPERLPTPERDPALGLPLVRVDPKPFSAVLHVALALDCALGRTAQVAGAFA